MAGRQRRTVQGINPRSGEKVGVPIPETTAAGLEATLAAAAAAAPVWRASSPQARTGLLDTLADLLDEQAGALAGLAAQESGLPLPRLAGEVARASGQLRRLGAVVAGGGCRPDLADGAGPAGAPEPLGPVLIFGTGNFPFACGVLGGDTASALASGCPVVAKAHPAQPGLSAELSQLARTAVRGCGLPAGVFGLVTGDQPGVAALRDPRIRAAGFTGSAAGGRLLAGIAARRPAPVPFYGELGSISPAVVTPAAAAARGEQIAAGFAASMTTGAGQLRTSPGLLFLPAGHGLEGALRDAVAAVAGGPAGVTAEHLGPESVVVEYAGAADLMAALATVRGSVTATVHAEPGDDFDLPALVARLRQIAGRVIWNGWPATPSAAGPAGATAIRRWLRSGPAEG